MPSEETLMVDQGIQNKAIQLRLRGRDYHRIAALLGCTTARARGYVKEAVDALEESEISNVTEITIVELARLDFMIGRLMRRIELDDQDSKAYELVLKVQARRAAYLGLDMQRERIEVIPGALSDAELRQRALRLMGSQSEVSGAVRSCQEVSGGVTRDKSQ